MYTFLKRYNDTVIHIIFMTDKKYDNVETVSSSKLCQGVYVVRAVCMSFCLFV